MEVTMEVFGVILLVIGVIVYFIGGIQFIIAECRESVWWFVGSFFIPILPFIFLCVHFHEAWPSTKKMLLGFLLIAVGAYMSSVKDVFDRRHVLRTQKYCPANCVNGGC
jgi:hypothetical protein